MTSKPEPSHHLGLRSSKLALSITWSSNWTKILPGPCRIWSSLTSTIYFLTLSENFEKYTKIADSNHSQIQTILTQNQNIETFLESATKIITDNQELTSTFNKKFIEFEENFELYKKQLQDISYDFETRYQYFYETCQSDISNIMKSQKDSNLSIEQFLDSLDERANNFESAVEKQIEESELRWKQTKEESGGSGGSFDLEKVQDKIRRFKQENVRNQEMITSVEKKMDNFRNEVNSMFVDYESENQRRFEKIENGVESLSRQGGFRNPLI